MGRKFEEKVYIQRQKVIIKNMNVFFGNMITIKILHYAMVLFFSFFFFTIYMPLSRQRSRCGCWTRGPKEIIVQERKILYEICHVFLYPTQHHGLCILCVYICVDMIFLSRLFFSKLFLFLMASAMPGERWPQKVKKWRVKNIHTQKRRAVPDPAIYPSWRT